MDASTSGAMDSEQPQDPTATSVVLDERSVLRIGDVLDQLFVFAGVVGVDGTMVDVNRGPLEIAGLVRADVLGRPFWQTWWWSHDDGTRARIRRAVDRARAGE